jgi:hypothetical protein
LTFKNLIKTKIITFILLLLIIPITFSFAWEGEYWKASLESNLDFNFASKADNIRLYDVEYIDGFDNKPLLQLSLKLYNGPWAFLTEGAILSLRKPLIIDVDSFFSPMVKLAYLEFDNDFFYFSIGRRKQSIGISDYNLFVNREMPFYDGLNISVGKDTGFRFDSLLSVSNLSKIYPIALNHNYSSPFPHPDDVPLFKDPYEGQHNKFFMYHAISYVGKTWFAMIGESAILANPKSIGDLNIFANIHNENSERANVGIEFQFAKIIKEMFLLSGLLAIDDLPIMASHSTPSMLADTPSAVGFGLGFKYKIIGGEVFQFPSFDSDKGIRKNTDFGLKDGGLSISLDYVATSRWFYQRSNIHDSSKEYFEGIQSFYNYFFNPQWITDRDHFSVPFGPKYGGDAQIISIKVSNETKKYKINGLFEIILLGIEARNRLTNDNYWGNADISYTDESDQNFSTKWITSGDIMPLFILGGSYEHGIYNWLSAYGEFKLKISNFDTLKYNLGFGATVSF